MRKYLFDSREKKNCHIRDYFDRHEIPYEIVKLDVGDYMLEGLSSVSIDRKHNMDEVSTNLLNRSDASRFWREIRRAHEQHIKLIILVESGRTVKTINDVSKWKSKYSGVSGRRLVNEMVRCEMAYGVRWAFTDRRSTARRIIELLTEYGKGENNTN